MFLTYLDGTTHNDELFDKPLKIQRVYMAHCLKYHPDQKFWNFGELDRVLAIRRLHGKSRFYQEVGRMLSETA